jgi:hypothetical protein
MPSKAIVTIVMTKVYLRPTRSPAAEHRAQRPHSEPGTEGGQTGQEGRALVPGREEQLAEEHGQRAVEIEVVPLEERAQARGQDDAADGGGGGALAGKRLGMGHVGVTLPYVGAPVNSAGTKTAATGPDRGRGSAATCAVRGELRGVVGPIAVTREQSRLHDLALVRHLHRVALHRHGHVERDISPLTLPSAISTSPDVPTSCP